LTGGDGLDVPSRGTGRPRSGRRAIPGGGPKAADFILSKMKNEQGRLLRRYRDGEAAVLAFQDDYAFLSRGLISLYEATFEVQWLQEAQRLSVEMMELFEDESGGFYYVGRDGEALIARSKEYYDGAMPSGNSVAVDVLMRLSRLTNDTSLLSSAEKVIQANGSAFSRYPVSYSEMLIAFDFILGPSYEIVLVGSPDSHDFRGLVEAVNQSYIPNHVLLHKPISSGGAIEQIAPFIKNHLELDGKPAAYVCKEFRCSMPTNDPQKLKELLAAT